MVVRNFLAVYVSAERTPTSPPPVREPCAWTPSLVWWEWYLAACHRVSSLHSDQLIQSFGAWGLTIPTYVNAPPLCWGWVLQGAQQAVGSRGPGVFTGGLQPRETARIRR